MVRLKRWTMACALLALPMGMAACNKADDASTDTPSSAPTLEELSSSTYEGITDAPVTLEDGRWLGEPFEPGGASRPLVMLVDELWCQGDLDGVDGDEAAVLLYEDSGGSGVFLYLAVVGRRGRDLATLGTARIGDRVQVRSMVIDSVGVVLDVIQAGPDDASCCPTQMATRTFAMRGGKLTETATEITGTFSVAEIEGVEWVLKWITRTEPAPDEPEVGFVITEGSITGTGGCNRFFGGITDEGPGQVSIGEIGATKMSCPEPIMAVERRFFRQLNAVTGYGYLAGGLALNWRVDGEAGTMVFEAREPDIGAVE